MYLKQAVDRINKNLNKDLKELSFWLNANKIVPNATNKWSHFFIV